jgi:hypothetical protein
MPIFDGKWITREKLGDSVDALGSLLGAPKMPDSVAAVKNLGLDFMFGVEKASEQKAAKDKAIDGAKADVKLATAPWWQSPWALVGIAAAVVAAWMFLKR